MSNKMRITIHKDAYEKLEGIAKSRDITVGDLADAIIDSFIIDRESCATIHNTSREKLIPLSTDEKAKMGITFNGAKNADYYNWGDNLIIKAVIDDKTYISVMNMTRFPSINEINKVITHFGDKKYLIIFPIGVVTNEEGNKVFTISLREIKDNLIIKPDTKTSNVILSGAGRFDKK